MEEVIIRQANTDDAERLAELYKNSFPEHILVHIGILDNPETFKNEIENVDNKHWIVADLGGKLVGAAALEWHDITAGGEIERVVVAEDYRRNGVSKKLCRTLLDVAREKNLEWVEAFARGTQYGMQKAFKDIGFNVYGISPRFSIISPNGETAREQFVHMGLQLRPDKVLYDTNLIPEAKSLYNRVNT